MNLHEEIHRGLENTNVGRVRISYEGPAPIVFFTGALGGGFGAVITYLLTRDPLWTAIGGAVGGLAGGFLGALVEENY